MKKKLLIVMLTLIVAIASAFALTACGETNGDGGSNTGNTGNGDNTDNTTVVTPDIPQIEVKLYIDGEYDSSVYTDSTKKYLITPPEKPEDISTNPNEERYFYGWFVDSNFQTPLTDRTTFKSNSKIYAKWISVRSSYYSYTVSMGKATITGLKYFDDASTVLVVPAYVNSFPVEAIAEGAFKDRTTIRSVVICNGIKRISGFNGCNSILDWSDVSIPESVETIGNGCFSGCSFSEVTIPDTVTSIGDDAFRDCTSLTSITIPNSVTSIGYRAFEGCRSLTNITIPNSVTSIGWNAFNCCPIETATMPSTAISAIPKTNLNTIVLTSGNSISDAQFENYVSLTSITIPNSVTSIGNMAFKGCSSLTSITTPDNVTSIGYMAFEGCSSLMSVTMPSSVTSIGSGTFRGCSSLTNITIPNSVTSIGGEAFKYCSSLKYNEYDNAYYLGNTDNLYLFLVIAKNKNIKSCKINSKTRFIYDSAFENCSSLTSITIPNSVTSMGSYVFAGWTSSQTIYCKATKQPDGWRSSSYTSDYWNAGCDAKIVWGYTGN